MVDVSLEYLIEDGFDIADSTHDGRGEIVLADEWTEDEQ